MNGRDSRENMPGRPALIRPSLSEELSIELNDVLANTSIRHLEISVRAYNRLKLAGVKSIGEVLSMSRYDFQAIPYLGKSCIKSIIAGLIKFAKVTDYESKHSSGKKRTISVTRFGKEWRIIFTEQTMFSSQTPLEQILSLQNDKSRLRPTESLGLSARSIHALKRNNITTIEELLSSSIADIAEIDHVGVGSLENIVRRLAEVVDGIQDVEDFRIERQSKEVVSEPVPTIQSIRILLDALSERDKSVVESRYGLNGKPKETLDEIGHMLGVSRERVRQIQKRGLKRLRYPQSKALWEPVIDWLQGIARSTRISNGDYMFNGEIASFPNIIREQTELPGNINCIKGSEKAVREQIIEYLPLLVDLDKMLDIRLPSQGIKGRKAERGRGRKGNDNPNGVYESWNRLLAGRSQGWLAKELGVHAVVVNRWVLGRRGPTARNIVKIYDLLGSGILDIYRRN